MSEPFIGEIRIFGFSFAPRGWAFCDGQLMGIAQNTALFSILGTTYGGNGTTTFGLPDLRSRATLGRGQGPGLSDYVLGEQSGVETVTLLATQMPAHNHLVNGATLSPVNSAQNTESPTPTARFGLSNPGNVYVPATPAPTLSPMNAQAIQPFTGNAQPHSNIQPVLTMSFCIALQGVFPARN